MEKWKSSNKKSIRKYGKAKENSGSRVIFPKLIFQKKSISQEKLEVRILQFCTLTLPSWLFLRKKLRYCINLIFYHSFLQNCTIIIAVLIFEKKHGSYRVNLCEKTENSVKNPTQWWFFLLIYCRDEPNCNFGWKWFYRHKGKMVKPDRNLAIFSLKRSSSFLRFYGRKN